MPVILSNIGSTLLNHLESSKSNTKDIKKKVKRNLFLKATCYFALCEKENEIEAYLKTLNKNLSR